MSDAKQAWDEVGERFAALGRHVKERYDANVAFGDDQKDQVSDALRNLTDALDAGFTAIGDTLRDPAMRDDLKGAGAAMADALTTSLNEVAEEIKKSVRK